MLAKPPPQPFIMPGGHIMPCGGIGGGAPAKAIGGTAAGALPVKTDGTAAPPKQAKSPATHGGSTYAPAPAQAPAAAAALAAALAAARAAAAAALALALAAALALSFGGILATTKAREPDFRRISLPRYLDGLSS